MTFEKGTGMEMVKSLRRELSLILCTLVYEDEFQTDGQGQRICSEYLNIQLLPHRKQCRYITET
jgi:hypothetical protein